MLAALMAMFVGGAVSAQSYPIVITPEITALEYPDKTSLRLRFDFDAQNLGDDVVTAIGWEVHGLPAGLDVATGPPPTNCALLIHEEPEWPFGNHVRIKRPEPLILNEGPNEMCNPILTDGIAPLEFYILDQTPRA